MVRPPRLFALAAVALAAGCAGPPIPAPIEGLPVCADFTTGNAKMEGGLRHPVRLRILDGKTVLYRTILTGLRHPDDPKPRSFIADDNARYTVEWAQCGNARAPREITAATVRAKGRERGREEEHTAYDCGEPKIYKGDGVMETKKHDRASHVLTFVPPPDLACWTSDTAELPPPAAPAAGDAGATSDTGDAGALEGDAGATTDAGAVSTHAGAAPRADAGAK